MPLLKKSLRDRGSLAYKLKTATRRALGLENL
jgi:hypothetical protein